MILIIGGMGQGKLDYVLKKTGLNKDDVATSLFQGWKKPVLNGLQDCICLLYTSHQTAWF